MGLRPIQLNEKRGFRISLILKDLKMFFDGAEDDEESLPLFGSAIASVSRSLSGSKYRDSPVRPNGADHWWVKVPPR